VSRVLVIGWDGGTWSVADRLCEQGRLPALASLRAGGAEGVLESVPNMNSAPAWSSVVTGLNPGRHGIFYFDEPVPGSYRRTMVSAQRRTGASLWRLASEAGKNIVVVNVPISYPAEQVKGALVAGLDSPSKTVSGFTYPPDLVERHAAVFRDYIIEPGAPSLVRAGRIDEAITKLYESVDGWADVTSALMDEVDWDLAFVVFTSTDTAQHFFWTPDRMHVIERTYELQDAATQRLVEKATALDPDVNVIVLADHGGAENTRGPEFLPLWLEDHGLMTRVRPSMKSRVVSSAFGLANRTLTREMKQALARRLPKLRELAEAENRLGEVRWDRTRAYADGRRDEVYVNVAGRDPNGTVSAADYDRFVSDLISALYEIRELDTGRPVVESAGARKDLYHGPYVDRAPDLTLRWVLAGPFKGFECETEAGRSAMRALAAEASFQPGGHHPHGLFVAKGPAIEGGAGVKGDLVDVTPTVLALLGAGVTSDLDGRPLGILKGVDTMVEESAAGNATAVEKPSGYSPEEEEVIRQRLEDLGYI
jgi:predicted AlkP superfamily phosphohydrolase/phosphomutase